jgi:hypothetical protein
MNNEILEYFLGIPIRRSNRIYLRLGASAYKALLAAQNETGLSAYAVLMHSCKPCKDCPDFVEINTASGVKTIKRGILSKHVPQKSGSNIFKQKQRKDAKSNSGSGED